jgi:hypothetical protein
MYFVVLSILPLLPSFFTSIPIYAPLPTVYELPILLCYFRGYLLLSTVYGLQSIMCAVGLPAIRCC